MVSNIECKNDTDWVKHFMTLEADGTREIGRLVKIWCEEVKRNMVAFDLSHEETGSE